MQYPGEDQASSQPTMPNGRAAKEAKTLARATVSSIAATIADGIVYQGMLFAMSRRYAVAAFAGALVGAVTNFVLNRYWAFPPTERKLATQVWMYALASLATYIGLQGALFALVEVAGIHERISWIPAKIVAWLVVSYPLHRFVVFARPRRRKEAIE